MTGEEGNMSVEEVRSADGSRGGYPDREEKGIKGGAESRDRWELGWYRTQ